MARSSGRLQAIAAVALLSGWMVISAAAAAAAPAACPAVCSANVAPVCGDDGLPYQSACVAACAGAQVRHSGYCSAPGPKALEFHAEGFGRASRKERQAAIGQDIMTAFVDAGFRYLGRIHLADGPSGPPAAAAARHGGANRTAEAGPVPLPGGADGKLHHALRYTAAGDVYYASFPAGGAGLLANITRIAPTFPPGFRIKEGGSSSGVPGGSRSGQRDLRMIIGADERGTCGQPPRYPYTAVGQLDFVQENQDYICSGALVRRDRVLTAAHCVWSIAERAFVRGVSFAAGRHRTPSGTVVSPFGVQAWKHVTLVSDFPSMSAAGSDMAVIQLDGEVSDEAGTMGVEAGCGAGVDRQAQRMQTAGYASDRLNGECIMETCVVSMGCGSDSTQHTCDTYMGQSGSPFWDSRNMVRGVHVRGMPTVNEFSNVNTQTLRSILAR